MGYDLHITRAKHWTDSAVAPITDSEWQLVVATDADLQVIGVAEAGTPEGLLRYENPGLAVWRRHPTHEQVWFDLRDGRVIVKNPDEPTIAKMIAVAGKLKARVIGDDGETYDLPGVPPRPSRLSVSDRLASWFQRLRPSPAPNVARPPFAVGARVRDVGGSEATVLAIDRQAMHGFGTIKVRFDDGRELTYAMFAHHLQLVKRKEPSQPKGL